MSQAGAVIDESAARFALDAATPDVLAVATFVDGPGERDVAPAAAHGTAAVRLASGGGAVVAQAAARAVTAQTPVGDAVVGRLVGVDEVVLVESDAAGRVRRRRPQRQLASGVAPPRNHFHGRSVHRLNMDTTIHALVTCTIID